MKWTTISVSFGILIYLSYQIFIHIYISIYNCSARAAAAEHRNHTVHKLSQLIVYTHKHIVTYIHIHIYINMIVLL